MNRQRTLRPGVEFVQTNGIGRFRYSAPTFHDGDIVDLTLPIGSHGEQITIRRLQIVTTRRNQHTGRVEYLLKDDARNRIDYTRGFEEQALKRHDISLPDSVCKRTTKSGKSCPAPTCSPSGLCIKHKAKLDWDRERLQRKLELELEKRRVEKDSPREQSTVKTGLPGRGPGDLSDLIEDGSATDETTQISLRMWGEADLFARTVVQQSYFQHQPPNSSPSYPSSLPFATPGLHLQVSNLRLFRTCLIIAYLAAITIASSLAVALWWTIAHHDPSGGFTMAGYIVAVGGIVLFPIQSNHSKYCTCWRRAARTPDTR